MSMSQPYHHPTMVTAAASSRASDTFQDPDISIGGSEHACAPGMTVPPDPSTTLGTADIVAVQKRPMGDSGDSVAMGRFQIPKVGGWRFSLCGCKLTSSFSKPLPVGCHFTKKGGNTCNIGAPSQSEGPAPGPSCESAVIQDTVDVRLAPEANRPNFCNPGAPSQLEGSLPGPSHQPADTAGVGSTPESSSFFQ